MKNLFKSLTILVLLATMIFSCQDELNESQFENDIFQKSNTDPYKKSGKLGADSKDIMRNAILEFTDFLKTIKVEDDAYKEVFYLLQTNHYVDSYVSLTDLLNYNTAQIYDRSDTSKFISGSFDAKLTEAINRSPNDFLNLDYIINNRIKPEVNLTDDQIKEQFYEIADITIYAPNIIDDKTEDFFKENDQFSIIPGVIDGDEGLGYAFNDSTNQWEDFTANESYSHSNMTFIIEPNYFCMDFSVPVIAEVYGDSECSAFTGGYSGADIGGGGNSDGGNTGNQYIGNCLDINQGDYIRQVFVGHVRCRKQYDAFISFSGNGGGSELQFTRTDSRENLEGQPNDSNVDVFDFTERFAIYKSRYAIRKKRERWYSVVWDFNWECAEPKHEQLFLIYEKDNTSPISFDFSGIEYEGETYGAVSLDADVRTKNEIIRTWKRDAAEFFVSNMLNDYGCGCKNGSNSFSDRCWPRYDCNATVRYTMPHRWVQY